MNGYRSSIDLTPALAVRPELRKRRVSLGTVVARLARVNSRASVGLLAFLCGLGWGVAIVQAVAR